MATPLLAIEEFGAELLRTEDLDPVYPMLLAAELPPSQLSRWLLAYWCFYHCGVASYISDAPTLAKFWAEMRGAAVNNRSIRTWPRGSERRHFRGVQAGNGVEGLAERFPDPVNMLEILKTYKRFVDLNRYVQSWRQFGPWIAFKVCDMTQAVLGHELSFEGASLTMYAEPVKGAKLAYQTQWFPGDDAERHPAFYVDYALERLAKAYQGQLAPPHYQRPLGLMEFETILCKWKSHRNGHYPVGHDTREIIQGLNGWGDTADRMRTILQERFK